MAHLKNAINVLSTSTTKLMRIFNGTANKAEYSMAQPTSISLEAPTQQTSSKLTGNHFTGMNANNKNPQKKNNASADAAVSSSLNAEVEAILNQFK